MLSLQINFAVLTSAFIILGFLPNVEAALAGVLLTRTQDTQATSSDGPTFGQPQAATDFIPVEQVNNGEQLAIFLDYEATASANPYSVEIFAVSKVRSGEFINAATSVDDTADPTVLRNEIIIGSHLLFSSFFAEDPNDPSSILRVPLLWTPATLVEGQYRINVRGFNPILPQDIMGGSAIQSQSFTVIPEQQKLKRPRNLRIFGI
ncbi:hypothetical protein BJ742DRAFT_196004 [Cladochytrium replicatum]|nr:hypothetical protein BJ742DRAFT_196004 [Cladochytrium replicatum]